MSRIAAVLRRTFGIVREHAGTDHLGNKYYFIPEQTTWTAATDRRDCAVRSGGGPGDDTPRSHRHGGVVCYIDSSPITRRHNSGSGAERHPGPPPLRKAQRATLCSQPETAREALAAQRRPGMSSVPSSGSLPGRAVVEDAAAAAAHRGKHMRAKRMVEAAKGTEYEYIEGSIPMEWDAWIRGRRKDPPSIEELLKNEAYKEQIKLKAKDLEEKDKALQAKEYEEGLVATPIRTVAKGHASATGFGKQEISEEPSSTSNTFQPGSWMPNSKK